MKRSLLAMILSYLLLIAVAVSAVFGVYYASKVHWLLGIFTVIIFILLFLAMIFYTVKFTAEFKGTKRRIKEYSVETYDLALKEDEIIKSIDKRFPSSSYHHSRGNEDGLDYEAYLENRSTERGVNIFLIHETEKMNTVDLDLTLNKIMSSSDIIPGTNETLIIVFTEKNKGEDENRTLYLNNPHNFSLKKMYVSINLKEHFLFFGGYTDLLSSGFASRIRALMMELFNLNKRD